MGMDWYNIHNLVHKIINIRRSYFWNYLRSRPLQAFGFITIAISFCLALIGPLIIPNSPIKGIAGGSLLPPSMEYWFGTDLRGMCIFSRVIAAYRTDLIVAFFGALLALLIGAPIGVFAGYFDGEKGFFGWVSMIILRIVDVVQAFPIFVLALLFVAAFGPNELNLVIALAIAYIPGNLRLARSEALTLRENVFIEAARASGNSDLQITFRHLLPNTLTSVIALLSMNMGFGILLTAGLSFVGAGVRVPTPEWGSMIAVGAPQMITGQWWPSFFPGFFMALTVFAFSMSGEAISALLDPLERVRLGYGG